MFRLPHFISITQSLSAVLLGWLVCSSSRISLALDNTPEIIQELRVVWGGPVARNYQGSLSIDLGSVKIIRNLSMQENALGSIQQKDASTIEILPSSATTFGGMDIAIRASRTAKITVRLRNALTDSVVERSVNLLDLQQKNWLESIDESGSRVAIERQVYDKLRVETRPPSNLIFECNSIWTPAISGYRTSVPAGEYHLIGTWAGRGQQLFDLPIRVDNDGSFAEVQPEIPIPSTEGAYRLELSLGGKNLISAISGFKPLISRSVEVMAFDSKATIQSIVSWNAVMALDTAVAVRPEGISWLTSFTGSLASRALEVPETLRIPGIDLTEQINRLIPISKSVTNFGAIARGGQVSVRDYQIEGSTTPQRTTVIAPQGWLSLPISGLAPHKPHRLRIQVPIDQTSSLSVSVHDSGSDGEALLDPQTCLEVREDDCKAGATLTHDFVFWPKSDSISILIASASRSRYALVGKILVESAELVSVPPSTSNSSGRQTAIYLDQPLLVESVAAPREKDPVSERYFESWRTWQAVAERIVQQLQLAQANTLVLTGIAGGNSVVPLKSMPQLHRLDKATFFTDGRFVESHDFMELLLLHFDRAGLKLVIEIDMPNAQQFRGLIDDPVQVAQVDLLAGKNRPLPVDPLETVRLNPLNRKVQQVISEPIREIAQRYGKHPSLAGVSIRLNTNSQVLFAGDRWGYNDDLIKQFSNDSGLSIPTDPKQKVQLFAGPARFRFVSWRAQQLTKFYASLAQSLAQEGNSVQLYLNVLHLLNRMPSESDFIDPDLIVRNPQQLLMSYGIDLASLADAKNIVITHGTLRQAKQILGNADWLRASMVESSHPTLAKYSSAALVTHQPRSLKLVAAETDRTKGTTAESWIYPDAARSGQQAKRIVLEQLWKSDVQLIGVGGWQPVSMFDNDLRGLLNGLKSLPPVTMTEAQVLSSESPVKIRTGYYQDKAYLTVLNLSSWEITVQIQTDGNQRDIQLMNSTESTRLQTDGATWQLRVPAFDMICIGAKSESSIKVLSANYQVPVGSIESTTNRLEKLEALLAHTADPGQQDVLFGVAGTFERWTATNKPIGWNVSALPQTNIQQASELPHSGSYSILIENRNADPVAAWIQSAPIALPESGRLTLRAWLRNSAADKNQPKVRIGLVGRLAGGGRYERSLLFGSGQNDPTRSLSSDWGRRPAELHVSDIPVDELTELQLAIDLIGPGRIWVDDVEVVQSWLHPDERNYLRGQMLVAKEQLSLNNPFTADLLLRSPWSEYLLELSSKMTSGKPAVNPTENQADRNRSKSSIQQLRDSMRPRWNR